MNNLMQFFATYEGGGREVKENFVRASKFRSAQTRVEVSGAWRADFTSSSMHGSKPFDIRCALSSTLHPLAVSMSCNI